MVQIWGRWVLFIASNTRTLCGGLAKLSAAKLHSFQRLPLVALFAEEFVALFGINAGVFFVGFLVELFVERA